MKFLLLPFFLLSLLTTAKAQLLTEPDKKMHFSGGAVFGSLSYAIVYEKTHDKKKAFFAGVAGAVLAGTIKEISDSTKSGNYFDGRDLLATFYGGLSVTVTLDIVGGRNGSSILLFGKKRKLKRKKVFLY